MPDECVFKVIREHQNGNNECGYAGKCAWCKVSPNMLTLKYMKNKIKTMDDAWMACETYPTPPWVEPREKRNAKSKSEESRLQ